MVLLAAHINDASISVVNSERLVYREPGFALLEDKHLVTGREALANARLKPRRIQNCYWSKLSVDSLKDNRFTHLSAADLVSQQLEQLWKTVSPAGDGLVIAVPAYMNKEHLALFLGIASELSVPIVGLVDAAVAATRREYQGAVAVHIDMGLHDAMMTRLGQDKMVRVERSEIVASSGVLSLYDAWIRKISDAFVKQSRFDPLHTAETEQILQDRLPEWLSHASGSDVIEMDISYRGIDHKAEIESLDLVAAAAPVYQRLASQLRGLVRAGETPALQLSDRVASMPGLASMLAARVGGEVFLLEPGATARGLLNRSRELATNGSNLSLVRQLPWDQAAIEVHGQQDEVAAGQPTHLLFASTAYPINDMPIVLGSQATDGARWIDMQKDMPGVSRRHCSLANKNGQCVVEDHSRYGTFLNGIRIDGSAALQTGDVIRLGTPGFEMQLIRTES